MTADLAAFLRAQISKEWDNVQLISGGGYEPDIWRTRPARVGDDRTYAEVFAYSRCIGEDRSAAVLEDDRPVALVLLGRNENLHVARYDPQRIADELDAKRRMLDWLDEVEQRAKDNNYWVLDVDTARKLLGIPYAHLPGYRPEWRI